MGYLTPQTTTDPRPDAADVERSRYLRSYLVMRALVGTVGLALPFVVVLVSYVLLGERPALRDSVSGYYYSGARDVLVGSLCAISAFLVTYKVVERTLDNSLSLVAGVAALGVAVFPTGRDDGSTLAPTRLQQVLGEGTVNVIHFVCAAVFVGSLAALSYWFGVRESHRTERRPGSARRSPRFWRTYHWTCTAIMVLAVGFAIVAHVVNGPRNALLISETVSALAFGASWLMKGLELDVLLGGPPRPRPPATSHPS
jgi:hypothetical protein